MQKPKVVEISETFFEIPELGHSVKIQTKQGRKIWICSCQNDSRFCNENLWCFDKQLVAEYIALKPIRKEINELIKKYQDFAGIKARLHAEAFLFELKDLERKYLR